MRADFPTPEFFQQVCEKGLSLIRPFQASAAAHDTWGSNFGRAKPPSYWAYSRLRALLALSEARALRPKRVLEVAAGDASLSACLQEAGSEVVVNDLRSDVLEEAIQRFRNRKQIRTLPGNVFDLTPEAAGCFDLVIACEVIEHVAHAIDFLRHLTRFLTPGGHILLTTPNGT
jgi:2-polyprenyl-6-hydroxyphenyl methylase/3-demethylubiquinone-9 3-methyltransferase